MTTPKRVTKRDNFLALSRVVVNSDLPNDEKVRLDEFISHEISLLDKKHNAKKTPTKTQLENAGIKDDIVGILEDASDEGFRATDIAGTIGITVQKASALLRQLVAEGRVERVQTGKVVTFLNKG